MIGLLMEAAALLKVLSDIHFNPKLIDTNGDGGYDEISDEEITAVSDDNGDFALEGVKTEPIVCSQNCKR